MSYWWKCDKCGVVMQCHELNSPCWETKHNLRRWHTLTRLNGAHGSPEDVEAKWVAAGYPLEELKQDLNIVKE